MTLDCCTLITNSNNFLLPLNDKHMLPSDHLQDYLTTLRSPAALQHSSDVDISSASCQTFQLSLAKSLHNLCTYQLLDFHSSQLFPPLYACPPPLRLLMTFTHSVPGIGSPQFASSPLTTWCILSSLSDSTDMLFSDPLKLIFSKKTNCRTRCWIFQAASATWKGPSSAHKLSSKKHKILFQVSSFSEEASLTPSDQLRIFRD